MSNTTQLENKIDTGLNDLKQQINILTNYIRKDLREEKIKHESFKDSMFYKFFLLNLDLKEKFHIKRKEARSRIIISFRSLFNKIHNR